MAQNMDPQWWNANFCTFYVFRMQTLILIILMIDLIVLNQEACLVLGEVLKVTQVKKCLRSSNEAT